MTISGACYAAYWELDRKYSFVLSVRIFDREWKREIFLASSEGILAIPVSDEEAWKLLSDKETVFAVIDCTFEQREFQPVLDFVCSRDA